MATHSSVLACRIPWTEERGGLQAMGSHRVGHDWATKHTQHKAIESNFAWEYENCSHTIEWVPEVGKGLETGIFI